MLLVMILQRGILVPLVQSSILLDDLHSFCLSMLMNFMMSFVCIRACLTAEVDKVLVCSEEHLRIQADLFGMSWKN